MNVHLNDIKDICSKLSKPLLAASEHGYEQYIVFDIDCTLLANHDCPDIYEETAHKAMFDQLNSITGPVLYWFAISSPTTTKSIISAFNKFVRIKGRRAVPAIRKALFHDTTILYVGKVKHHFKHRVKTHLGYYQVERTQGLQLCYWSRESNLQLKLHVHTFKDELAPMLGSIEVEMARKLKPLLGKHR